MEALSDCAELSLPVPSESDLDPATWQQFKFSELNKSRSEREAQDLFARDWAEIAARDWQWYLRTAATEEEAKILWFRQRRRYGLPLPPIKARKE